jgi:hypothetical protein
MTRGTGVNHSAQRTVDALVPLERRHTLAAGMADDLATSRGRREANLGDTRVQAQEVYHAGQPRPCLHNAVKPAAQTKDTLQNGADFGDKLLAYPDLAQRDLQLARETGSASASRAAPARVSAPELEALPQPRATHDAEKGLAATRRWHTLSRTQGKPRSGRPRW